MIRAALYILNEWVLRIGLGLLFVYAGLAKVIDLEELFTLHRFTWATQQFMTDVQHFEITTYLDAWSPGLSWDASILIATYLPWLEIFAGLALCLRRLYAGGIAICGVLSVGFLGAIGSAWWRGLDITCGCFGREVNKTPFASHIVLNLVMLAAAGALAGMEWRRARMRHILFMKLRALVCLLLAAWYARAEVAPIPMRDALASKTLAFTVRGNARDQLTIAVRNNAADPIAIEIPAGLVCTGKVGAVVTLRAAALTVPARQTAEAMLPVVARSAKNGFAEQPFAITSESVPALAPLLTYAATRNDFPKATAQLVALALIEDVTFAGWQHFLAPQRSPDAVPMPSPVEITTAIDALGVLREIAPERKFALGGDDELKLRALRNPFSRAKAMRLYGMTLPDGLVAPDLQQLLHTKPGDNCPICRMRAQMPDAGNGF